MIPSKIHVKGLPSAYAPGGTITDARDIADWGFPDWKLGVRAIPGACLHEWFLDGELVHLQVSNTLTDPSAPAIYVRDTAALGPMDGWAWTEDMTYERLTVRGPSAHDRLLAMTDSDRTNDTGSSRCDFFHPIAVEAYTYGKGQANDLGAGQLLDYVERCVRRPRSWFDANGNFAGIRDGAKIPNFNEIRTNGLGLNATDNQHIDGTDLYWAVKLLNYPPAWFQLVNLWLLLYRNSYRLREDHANTYGGVPRTVGWWLTLCGQILDLLKDHPWPWLEDKVKASALWHLDQFWRLYPMWTQEGSAGWAQDASGRLMEHQKLWMYSTVAWGILWVEKGAYESKYMLGGMTLSNVETLLRGMDRLMAPTDDGLLVELTRDGTREQRTKSPGTMAWMAAPMLWSGGEYEVAKYVKARYDELGLTDPGHQHYGQAVRFLAPAMGLKTGLEG